MRAAATLLLSLGAAVMALAQAPATGTSVSRMTVTAPASTAAAADRLRALDLPRLAADLARAGLALPLRLDVELIPEDDPRARTVPDWIVGVATGDARIVIFPERVLPYPYDSLESVFRHEVAHVALDALARDRLLPRWFHEGVAVSVDTGWGAEGQLRLLLAMVRDPVTADLSRLFAAGEQSEATEAYALSAALVADLRRRHGDDTPGAIAARVGAGAPFARAFIDQTGETPDQAARRAWASYRRWVAWVPSVTSATALWGGILALAVVAFVARLRRRARQRRQWDEEARLELERAFERSGQVGDEEDV